MMCSLLYPKPFFCFVREPFGRRSTHRRRAAFAHDQEINGVEVAGIWRKSSSRIATGSNRSVLGTGPGSTRKSTLQRQARGLVVIDVGSRSTSRVRFFDRGCCYHSACIVSSSTGMAAVVGHHLSFCYPSFTNETMMHSLCAYRYIQLLI